MAITVIGSAPFEEDIPDSRIIFAANGSVAHLTEKGIDPSKVRVLFANGYFGDPEAQTESALLVRNSPYSKIILRESLLGLNRPSSREALQAFSGELELLTYKQMFSMWTSQIGLLETLVYGINIRSLPAHFLSALKSLRHQEDLVERLASVFLSNKKTKLSSGVLAVMLAVSAAHPEEIIHVYGISLTRNHYAYPMSNSELDRQVKGHEGHVTSDIFMLSRLVNSKENEIVIWDTELRNRIVRK